MKPLQLDKPHALIVVGIQGSGKTFFAKKFADTFKAPFLEQSMFSDLSRDEAAAGELMGSMTDELSKTGRSIVIELAQSSRSGRTELVKRLKSVGYVPLFVWVQVDLDTAMSRTYRAHRIDDQTYRDTMRAFSQPHPSEKALVISGKHTFATQAKAVLKKLVVPRGESDNPTPPRSAPARGQIIVR